MKVFGLFSGIGGFELGFQRAGYEVTLLSEIEPHCIRVLEKNFEGVPIDRDVTKLSIEEGQYDVLTGGFPCSDISIGSKTGTGIRGERSGLWDEYKRLIKEGKPKYAVIENVFTLLSRGLEVILQDLAEIGYDATWTMLDTKFMGLPQRRRRVYIVGVRDGIPRDTDIFQFERRNTDQHRSEVKAFSQGFEWDFTQGEGESGGFAYFTRQRSDEFAGVGLASTLMKRDHKDFTDVILQEGHLRRVSPEERLLLQGFPVDWWEGCGLTKTQKYMCNGMSVPVVQYVAEKIKAFDLYINSPF